MVSDLSVLASSEKAKHVRRARLDNPGVEAAGGPMSREMALQLIEANVLPQLERHEAMLRKPFGPMASWFAKATELVNVLDDSYISDPDQNTVSFKLMSPKGVDDSQLPCIIYYHGGGMMAMSSYVVAC